MGRGNKAPLASGYNPESGMTTTLTEDVITDSKGNKFTRVTNSNQIPGKPGEYSAGKTGAFKARTDSGRGAPTTSPFEAEQAAKGNTLLNAEQFALKKRELSRTPDEIKLEQELKAQEDANQIAKQDAMNLSEIAMQRSKRLKAAGSATRGNIAYSPNNASNRKTILGA